MNITKNAQTMNKVMEQTPPTKSKGGRPKGDPDSVKTITIGVRVSPSEFETLEGKAKNMGMFPAQWLREAALTRRLPSPPVPAVNVEQYAELARLAANLNQLAKHANAGRMVTVNNDLLRSTTAEVQRLREALLGSSGGEE
jgi:hypothetical protein